MICLGVHIRSTSDLPELREVVERLDEHLKKLYRQFEGNPNKAVGKRDFSTFDFAIDHVYIGDEFCANRLPTVEQANAFAEYAQKNGIGLALLTPVLVDRQIDEQESLFAKLHDLWPGMEVTVNDWGVLFFLKQRFPGFRLALGRLLNKGLKDPRWKTPEVRFEGAQDDAERAILGHCTFDQVRFRKKAGDLGVRRLERDLFPYRDPTGLGDGDLRTSCYFPFGYVTTGRVCWQASFEQPGRKHFMPVNGCARPCRKRSFTLAHTKANFPVSQNGNTVFYLYPSEVLEALFKISRKKDIRLVYQGRAL